MHEELGRRRRLQSSRSRQPLCASRYCPLFAFVAVLLATPCAKAADALARSGSSVAEYRPVLSTSADVDDAGLLVVTLLDGRVVAVRQDSGEELWTYDTGMPLVTVKQSQAMAPGLRIFPGVDGGLYAYGNALRTAQDDSVVGGGKLERLPITLPELVDTSPSVTDDGSVIVGKRLTRVYVLDRRTGALMQLLSEGAAAAAAGQGRDRGQGAAGEGSRSRQNSEFGFEDMPVLEMLDPDQVVLLGREDYVVRSMQIQTGMETWNATYSRLVRLGPPSQAAQPGRVMGGPLPGSSQGSGDALPFFTLGANHTLQAHDPTLGVRRWAITFHHPPVGVFGPLDGDTNLLEPSALKRQHAQLQRVQQQQSQQQLQPVGGRPAIMGGGGGSGGAQGGAAVGASGGDGSGGGGGGSKVLLGLLPSGGMYAMPADHLLLDDPPAEARPLPTRLPALPGPRSSPSSPAALAPDTLVANQDKALALIGGGHDVVASVTQDDTGEGLVSGLACLTGVTLVTTVSEPIGDPQQRPPWLPDAPRGLASANATTGGGGPVGARHTFAGAGSGFAAWVYGLSGVTLAGGTGGGGGSVINVVLLVALGGGVVAVYLSQRRTAAMVRAALDMAAAAEARAQSGGRPEAAATTNGAGGDGAEPGHVGNGVGRGAGAGGSGGAKRRKGRAASGLETAGKGNGSGDGGGSAVAVVVSGRDAALPKIDEDEQLATNETLAPLAVRTPSAASLAASAPHLPSAEARVRVLEDGSLAIGRLRVGPGILGYGSAGTVVYEGVLDGRPVAVKRLLRQFTELARKEIEVLILSDEHPNVVRCFAMEEDREFVYLALERCRSTLSDFLDSPAGREQFVDPGTRQPTARCTTTMLDICRGLAALHERGVVHRDLKPHNVLITEVSQRAKLSDMGLSKQLVPEQSSFESHHGPGGSSGWQAPEQLIARDGGAARQTRSMDVFSLGCILYYCMTGGRHPFGDNHYERDSNILHGAPSLAPLAASAGHEAVNLVGACLAKDAARRPTVAAVLEHPLWWSEERRLGFLVDISDRIENEDREPDTTLLEALESFSTVALAGPGTAAANAMDAAAAAASPSPASASSATSASASSSATPSSTAPASTSAAASLASALAVGSVPNWGALLPPDLVANLGKYRRYDYTSLRDLLRVVRNKRNHFREMPQQLQTLLGPLPGGFLRFFAARFPRLLLSVYVFAAQHLAEEPNLKQYWRGEAQPGVWTGAAASSQPFVQIFLTQYGPHLKPAKAPAAAPAATAPGAATSASQQVQGSTLAAPSGSQQQATGSERQGSADAALGLPGDATADPSALVEQPVGAAHVSSAPAAAASTTAGTSSPYPADPVSTLSPLLTAAPLGAATPIATPLPQQQPSTPHTANLHPAGPNPPPPTPGAPVGVPTAVPWVIVGYTPSGDDSTWYIQEFPRRPGKTLCDFYIKTGHCKFGDECVFDHPAEYAVRRTTLGLPLRPGEPLCSFYLKNNNCRFGPSCKFHHPMLRPVYAGSAAGVGSAPDAGPVASVDG